MMRRYLLIFIAATGVIALTQAQDTSVSLRERAEASPDGRHVTILPANSAPSYPDLEKITHLSTGVITGTAVSNRTRLSADGNFINTIYTVTVQNVLKGQGLRPGGQIKVSLPGGRYGFKTPDGREAYAEVRTPWFKKMENGKTYYLFLTVLSAEARTEDDLQVSPAVVLGTTGGPQGVFEVVGGVVKSNSGRLRDPAWQYHNLPMDTFAGLIRDSLTRDPVCSAPQVSCAH